MITRGLQQVMVGEIAPDGGPATVYAKLGKVYKDTCKIAQDKADVTEHFEEGQSSPEVRTKTKKSPVVTFSIMDPDIDTLVSYMGGVKTGTGTEADPYKFGYDGDEIVAEKSIKITSVAGLTTLIPRADIEAVINEDKSEKGIFLLDFTVTPLKPTKAGVKSYQAFAEVEDDGE